MADMSQQTLQPDLNNTMLLLEVKNAIASLGSELRTAFSQLSVQATEEILDMLELASNTSFLYSNEVCF